MRHSLSLCPANIPKQNAWKKTHTRTQAQTPTRKRKPNHEKKKHTHAKENKKAKIANETSPTSPSLSPSPFFARCFSISELLFCETGFFFVLLVCHWLLVHVLVAQDIFFGHQLHLVICKLIAHLLFFFWRATVSYIDQKCGNSIKKTTCHLQGL